MDENLQPPEIDEPESRPIPPRAEGDSPSFIAMFFCGMALIIGTAGMGILSQSVAPFVLGAIAAIISLFIKGFRGVFVGFVLTGGFVILTTIIYCSNHHFGG